MGSRKRRGKSHPHAKGTTVGVRLSEQDVAALAECARLESEQRNAIVHESALLRELGMPQVLVRLRELSEPALRATEDRRTGAERRAVGATS